VVVDGGNFLQQSVPTTTITGTVRHTRCQRLHVPPMASFVGGMCAACISIPSLLDFKGRVTRVPRGPNAQFTNLR
jgi:hypothetical protein